MRILVTGGTGFLGTALCEVLGIEGHDVTVVTREPARVEFGRGIAWSEMPAAMATADAVVNLAGEPVAGKRWTADRKRRIRDSRVDATRALVDAMAQGEHRPTVFISGSAIGYYGPRDSTPIDETAPPGTDFLAGVCQAWEAEAQRAETLGVRTVRLRIGVVLGPDGGALKEMIRPFRFLSGGPLGDGTQYLSWIHRVDVIGLILAALASKAYGGPINATALEPVSNAEFTTALSRVINRPAMMPGRLNAWILRRVFGEMADMLLTGQCVLPGAAIKIGYGFRYPNLMPTLRSVARV